MRTKVGNTRTRAEGVEKDNKPGGDTPAPPRRMTTSGAERQEGCGQTTSPEDREEGKGEQVGYTPTPEDLRLWKVYGDWFHANPVTHLDGGIRDDAAWQAWWRGLAVMPSRGYDAPRGKVRR